MENNSQVKIVSAKNIDSQFGKEAMTSTKHVTAASVTTLFIVLIFAIISKTQDEPKPTQGNGFQSPNSVNGTPTNSEIPFYSRAGESLSIEAALRNVNNRKVLKVTTYPGPKLIGRPFSTKIPPGSMVKAVLLNGASNELVRAKTTESLMVNGSEILEEGVTLIGKGQSSSDSRLCVRYDKVVNKEGAFQSIQAQAVDFDDKMPCLSGSKVGQYGIKLMLATGLNFVSGLSQGMRDREAVNGVVLEKSSVRNGLLNGAQNAGLELSREMMTAEKTKPLSVEVPSDVPVFIIFE
jgi:hypothetical protein